MLGSHAGDGGALLSSLLSSTQTAVKSERGRISKIRARHDMRNEETRSASASHAHESQRREQEVVNQKPPQRTRADPVTVVTVVTVFNDQSRQRGPWTEVGGCVCVCVCVELISGDPFRS